MSREFEHFPYNISETNNLVSIISTDGPRDILTYDALQGSDLRYIAPVYYAAPIPTDRRNDLFPPNYRTIAYFPYASRTVFPDLHLPSPY